MVWTRSFLWTLFFFVFLSSNTMGMENEDHQTLHETNECPNCNLRGITIDDGFFLSSVLNGADLSRAKLINSNFRYSNFSGSNLYDAELKGGDFESADFSSARLKSAVLENPDVKGADFSNSDLSYANLETVDFKGTNLTHADFSFASLGEGTSFNDTLGLEDILFYAEYPSSIPKGLLSVRDRYKKSGNELIEKKITYTLKHNEMLHDFSVAGVPGNLHTREINLLDVLFCIVKAENKQIAELSHNTTARQSCAYAAFSLIFFEWTTQWGVSPEHALALLFKTTFIFSFGYFVALSIAFFSKGNRRRFGSIWIVNPVLTDITDGSDPVSKAFDQKMPNEVETKPIQIVQQEEEGVFYRYDLAQYMKLALNWSSTEKTSPILKRLAFFGLAAVAAFWISLLMSFHFGWRDLNVGTWMARIQPKPFLFRTTGLLRVFSGVQSLACAYFLAIWALTFFGRPFG